MPRGAGSSTHGSSTCHTASISTITEPPPPLWPLAARLALESLLTPAVHPHLYLQSEVPAQCQALGQVLGPLPNGCRSPVEAKAGK